MSTTTESDIGGVQRVFPALCVLLGSLGVPLAILNPVAGIMTSIAALVWSLIAIRTRLHPRYYRFAVWIAAVALLLNVAVVMMSLTAGIEGPAISRIVPGIHP